MTLYATERIDDAASLTRSLLLPFDWRLWARLAVVVAFISIGSGGGGTTSSATNLPSTVGSVGEFPSIEFGPGEIAIGESLAVLLAAVVGGLVLVGLAAAAVGAVMEFVFVRALAEEDVRVRAWFRAYVGKGLRLFGFRLVLGALAAVLIAGPAAALFWAEISTLLAGGPVTAGGASIVGRLLVVVLLAVVVGVTLALVHGITTEFVVPVMLVADCGVLAGWRRFWPTFRGQLKQYVVYLVVGFALRIATGIGAGIVIGILTVIVAIPFAVVGLALGFGALTSGTFSTPLVLGFVVLGIGFVIVLFLVAAVVYVPVMAFHRYFALLVLGDTDADLDLVPDRRPSLEEPFETSATE